MMIVKTVMRKLIGLFKNMEKWAAEEPVKALPVVQAKTEQPKQETVKQTEQVQSVWDYLAVKENTQAAHAVSTIGFEEWVEMQEIRRRIRELFGMDYKNERSLYPYIKAMVDCGLFESTDVGGVRKWRKKALLLKLKQAAEKEKQEQTQSESSKSAEKSD